MEIIFLGQAGFLLKVNEKIILIDPYLSDNVKNFNPQNYRRQEINAEYLNIKPDVIVITHDHLDHYDKETLKYFITNNSCVTVLAPNSVWQDVRKIGGNNNYILFNALTSVTLLDVTFSAVKAEHSDPNAIGVIVKVAKENYYFTGDTLYSENVFLSLPKTKFKAVFLPINGVGNNMNVIDAEKFVKRLKVKNVVPCHFGMFDGMTGKEIKIKNVVVPSIYKEIKLK